jgi:hypothetical protein
MAGRLGAAPSQLSFGDSVAQAGARPVRMGVIQAPGTNGGRSARTEIKRAGSVRAPGPCHFNKEQTPPGDLLDPSPRIHGGCFGV